MEIKKGAEEIRLSKWKLMRYLILIPVMLFFFILLYMAAEQDFPRIYLYIAPFFISGLLWLRIVLKVKCPNCGKRWFTFKNGLWMGGYECSNCSWSAYE